MSQCRGNNTFKLETRSAVSRRVSWLIWSTIAAILGFSGAAAASVEFHRLGVETIGAAYRKEPADRNWRAQRCAAYLYDRDIVCRRIGERETICWTGVVVARLAGEVVCLGF